MLHTSGHICAIADWAEFVMHLNERLLFGRNFKNPCLAWILPCIIAIGNQATGSRGLVVAMGPYLLWYIRAQVLAHLLQRFLALLSNADM